MRLSTHSEETKECDVAWTSEHVATTGFRHVLLATSPPESNTGAEATVTNNIATQGSLDNSFQNNKEAIEVS